MANDILEFLADEGINIEATSANKTIILKADSASTSRKGIVRLATDAEMTAGNDNTVVPTVKQLKDWISLSASELTHGSSPLADGHIVLVYE
jgi:hypothetical protein